MDIYRDRILAQLRKNLLSSRSRFEEKNYKTGMWFDYIFNFSIKFSMCSISVYEVDPCVLYLMHTGLRLKDI